MDRLHAVVIGNPFDGLSLYGPFDDATLANDWADEYVQADKYGLDWWVVPLNDPEEDESES